MRAIGIVAMRGPSGPEYLFLPKARGGSLWLRYRRVTGCPWNAANRRGLQD
jgi:hypothetical protein